VLDAHLDRVIAGPPREMTESQLIPQGPALLALVLDRARIDPVGRKHSVVVGHCVGVIGAIDTAADAGGIEGDVLVGQECLVEPAVGAAFPARSTRVSLFRVRTEDDCA